jgi:hypothetical protein
VGDTNICEVIAVLSHASPLKPLKWQKLQEKSVEMTRERAGTDNLWKEYSW